MGFKKLHFFNMDLLAKQGWRIIQNESTLLHKIFKARYFPLTSFKDSHLGSAPSYVWRGIWEAKDALLKGCMWRVGDGKCINIWIDYWLPNHRLMPASETVSASQMGDLTVASLIDESTRW